MSHDINITICLKGDYDSSSNVWQATPPDYPCEHVNGASPYPAPSGMSNIGPSNIDSITAIDTNSGNPSTIVTVDNASKSVDINNCTELCNLHFYVTLQGAPQQFGVYWGLVLLDNEYNTKPGRWSWAGSSTATPPSNLLVFNPDPRLSSHKKFEYYIVISRPNPNGPGTQYAVIDPRLQTR